MAHFPFLLRSPSTMINPQTPGHTSPNVAPMSKLTTSFPAPPFLISLLTPSTKKTSYLIIKECPSGHLHSSLNSTLPPQPNSSLTGQPSILGTTISSLSVNLMQLLLMATGTSGHWKKRLIYLLKYRNMLWMLLQ